MISRTVVKEKLQLLVCAMDASTKPSAYTGEEYQTITRWYEECKIYSDKDDWLALMRDCNKIWERIHND